VITYIAFHITGIIKITKDPSNMIECLNDDIRSGSLAIQMPCGFTGAPAGTTLLNWRIIRRAENGSVISDVTRNISDINNDLNDRLFWVADLTSRESTSPNSFLTIGPVDKTFNQSSYQCSFQLDNQTSIISKVGTVTLIGEHR